MSKLIDHSIARFSIDVRGRFHGSQWILCVGCSYIENLVSPANCRISNYTISIWAGCSVLSVATDLNTVIFKRKTHSFVVWVSNVIRSVPWNLKFGNCLFECNFRFSIIYFSSPYSDSLSFLHTRTRSIFFLAFLFVHSARFFFLFLSPFFLSFFSFPFTPFSVGLPWFLSFLFSFRFCHNFCLHTHVYNLHLPKKIENNDKKTLSLNWNKHNFTRKSVVLFHSEIFLIDLNLTLFVIYIYSIRLFDVVPFANLNYFLVYFDLWRWRIIDRIYLISRFVIDNW